MTPLLLLLAGAAHATTYGIRVVNVCPSGFEATGCVADSSGTIVAASAEDLERAWTTAVTEMNYVYDSVGLSFRLLGIEVYTSDSLAAIDAVDDNATQLEADLWPMAGESPDALTIFQLPLLPGGSSALPCTTSTQRHCTFFDPAGPDSRVPLASLQLFFPYRGSFVAHEVGHHFCLPHTHTELDFGDASYTTYGDDGDDFMDTPDDPAPEEQVKVSGVWTPERELPSNHWCELSRFGDTTPIRSRNCSITCYETDSHGKLSLYSAADPFAALDMSYYMPQCTGPIVGNPEPGDGMPFSVTEIARIGACLTDIPERAALVDLCLTTGDQDNDGVCDGDDPCPAVPNESTADMDGDAFPDECDLCPTLPSSQDDFDGDSVGDECDPDSDNDGCADDVDLDVYGSRIGTGGTYCPCESGGGCYPVDAFAGGDTDGDGVLDCAEEDPDADGRTGSDDPCPLDPTAECVGPTTYGVCGDLDLGIEDLQISIGPGPCTACTAGWAVDTYTDIDWVRFDGARGLLYATLPAVSQPGELAQSIAGADWARLSSEALASYDFSSVVLSRYSGGYLPGLSAPDSYEVTVRLRDTGARVGSFQIPAFDLGSLRAGRYLVLDVGDLDAPVALSGAWGFGVDLDAPLADADADGTPDLFDTCSRRANPDQRDQDRDRFGDACDADFDQDGVVTDSDLSLAEGCEGALVELPPFTAEDSPDAPSSADALRAIRCERADLDGDGTVDADDIGVVTELFGGPPGPSAWSGPQQDDGGDTGTDDTGTDDSGADDSGTDDGGKDAPSDDPGCGCATPAPATGGGMGLLLGLALLRRRRAA